MEHRAPSSSAASANQSTSSQTVSSEKHCEGRGAWVLTVYGISGLALIGVLAYYFSDFVTR